MHLRGVKCIVEVRILDILFTQKIECIRIWCICFCFFAVFKQLLTNMVILVAAFTELIFYYKSNKYVS